MMSPGAGVGRMLYSGACLLALLGAAAGQAAGADFQVSDLPPLTRPEAPQALSQAGSEPDWIGLDVEALERFNAAVNFDQGKASPEEKAANWRRLAGEMPQLAPRAESRAAQWERYTAQKQAAEQALETRIAVRDSDWARLAPLLSAALPDLDKKRWSERFAAAYLESPGIDPASAAALARHLPSGRAKDAVERLARTAWAGMVCIPAGSYMMGSPEGSGSLDEQPRHNVYLDAFCMDRYEVTAAQYRKFCAATGRVLREQPASSRDEHPVVNVDWSEAQAFCRWEGKRLPTEAEWEKAARGGADFKYGFGDDEGKLGKYAWHDQNSGGQIHPRGRKKSNRYGLYDIYGNVWEWVSDWYDADYYRSSPERNPQGPASGQYRVSRGGSWDDDARSCRAASRRWNAPDYWKDNRGFRCVRRK